MPHSQTGLRQPPAAAESPSRAILALVISCLLVVLVPAMVALIGYRSIMLHGPSTAVVIGGDPSLDGAKVVVSESIEPHRKWTTVLDRSNGWQSPILLDPGPYHVTVTHLGKDILSENFAPDQFNGVRFDLPSMVLIVGNNILAESRIEIMRIGDNSHLARVTPVKLSEASHYREPVYLLAGDYRAVARSLTSTDVVLAQADFSVDRTAPVRVDLTKPPAKDQ